MDSSHLRPDEFLVECATRKIKGTPKQVQDALNEAWQFEKQFPPARPSEMHVAAAKNPMREINLCTKRLSEIERQLQEAVDTPDFDFSVIKSRLLHLSGRLFRATLVRQ